MAGWGGQGEGTITINLEGQGIASFSPGPCNIAFPTPSSPSPGEELQLRVVEETLDQGCQAEPPPANKAALLKSASLTPSLAQRGPKDMIPGCL